MVPRDIVDELEQRVKQLLEDDTHQGHPLYDALKSLWERMVEQLSMLEHVVEPDVEQHPPSSADQARSLSQRYQRQLHRLERVIQISDRYQIMLKDLNDSLHEAATHDQLTGIPNRRLMADRCRDEDERCMRHGVGYCMAVFDADHFKLVNDAYGHDVGDKVLIELAGMLRRNMREYDLCARWGGEEFLALFVGVSVADGLEIVDRILTQVREMVIPVNGEELRLTVSVGIAQHERGETYVETFTRADAALYEAKESGRNRCIYRPFIPG
ncbi:MAG: biofilm regulation diguanylate cyclase SiaD [Prochlorococcaceae cyanobacterium]|jgi:diguanylate cyclase (GGDEF)-like protein